MTALPKHERYQHAYKPSEEFWGLGIENETYLEVVGGIIRDVEWITKNRERERYSVDYWKLYKEGVIDEVFTKWKQSLPRKGDTPSIVPLLINGHSLTKCDISGNHATLYTKQGELNPAFGGKTLIQDLGSTNSDIFIRGRDVWWTFDGDTIEFMTQGFYNATLEDVLEEWRHHKLRWLTAFRQGLKSLGSPLAGKEIRYPLSNYGLAVFHTNPSNIAIFNNGTYHFNITLPTLLDKDARIADMAAFTERHRRVARLFQWISPLLVALHGSGDVFQRIAGADARFPVGSQRLSASRYVGLGTYDTVDMKRGKTVTVPYSRVEGRWLERMYDVSGCAYNILPEIGLDINFNKHWNHGLEFRIFDWFPEDQVANVLRMLLWMCDQALVAADIPDPRTSSEWNRLVADALWFGMNKRLGAVASVLSKVCGVAFSEDMTLYKAYGVLWSTWRDRWNMSVGTVTAKMTKAPLPMPRPLPTATAPVPVVEQVPIRRVWCMPFLGCK